MAYLSDPVEGASAVTASDTTVLKVTRGVYIGGAGDLAVTLTDGTVITFIGVVAGSALPIRITKVMAATTATAIIALY